MSTSKKLTSKMTNTEQLLSYCYTHKRQYIFDGSDDVNEGIEQFECLISLVEDGTVSSMEDLAEYGMDY